MRAFKPFISLGIPLLLCGCAVSAPRQAIVTPAAQAASITATATLPVPTGTATSPPTATRVPSPTATPAFALCSPLAEISLADLGQPDLLKNPFQLPRPGMDDGHQGDDFAYWSRGDRKTMLGLPVLSVLAGKVAGVIPNRQPYGNAIIIETPLEGLPQSWLQSIPVPTPAPTVPPAPNLNCPADPNDYDTRPGRSLYLLYAHLNQTPSYVAGDTVSCGQEIGEVGTTGSSVNPHLHLETRVGPSGATFASMAYYTTASTDAERSVYCTWRVSGLFQMFDPMTLFK